MEAYDGGPFPMKSVLSAMPDGMGYYHGFVAGDTRRIDIRLERELWEIYVAGENIGWAPTKDEAEKRAVNFVHATHGLEGQTE